MTQRVSREHHEDTDLGDITCINLKLAKDLKTVARGDSFKAGVREFPALQPL